MNEGVSAPLHEWMESIIDYRGKTPKKTDSGVPLVTAKVIKAGRINTLNEFIASEDYDEWMRRGIPKEGDVVITTEAPLGEIAQLPKEKVALAQRVITLRGKPNLVDNTYLKYLLLSRVFQHDLQARATGTTVLGIKQSVLRQIKLSFPSFSTQRKIAHILGTLDAKIELNKRTNETLEAIAKALFKSWFIDFDPVRAKADGHSTGLPDEISNLFPDSFEDSELGEIPSGWEISKISDICNSADYVANGSFSTLKENVQKVDFYNGKEAILLRFSDFNKNWEDNFSYITQDSYNFLDKSKVFPGDLVVCNVGDVGNFFRAPDLGLPMSLGPNGVLLKDFSLKGKLSNPYFYFLLSTNYFQFQLQSISSGSVQTKFNKTELRGLISLVPPKNLVKISTVLFDEILSKKDQLFKQNRILKNIRDTILPKLISGELRIPDAEKMIED